MLEALSNRVSSRTISGTQLSDNFQIHFPGTHAILMKLEGIYFGMVNVQMGITPERVEHSLSEDDDVDDLPFTQSSRF